MLHGGYEIWISDSDGQRLPEYNIELEGDDRKTTACFIPSESGKRFVINWKDYNNGKHASLRISVDGVLNVANISWPGKGGKRIGVRTNTVNKYSAFQFADLRTTDDDSALLASGHACPEKVGTIEVRVVHIHPQPQVVPFTATHYAGVGPVHERSKKLGAHCVTLGEEVKADVSRSHRRASRPLDPRGRPHATFVFRYRPLALLQAQGIAPPEPGLGLNKEEPGQPSSSNGRDETRVPVKSEPRPASQLHANVIQLYDSEESVDRKPALRVKREADIRRVAIKSDPDDVIDLTLDE
ncbi:hypothetical protein FKP32DRAFT_511700 [Trametes sanguinea]|nr:hypothetical protein FKP32DRAFT_511700 [Trametes sanguinea]